MHRRLLILFLFLAHCGAVLAQKPLDDAATRDLLRRLDQLKEKNGGGMSADFTETRQTRLLREPLVTRGSMVFQSPDKFRRELRGSNQSITVSNGRKLWIYYPNFKEAELYTMGEQTFFDDSISALTAGLNYARMPEYYQIEAYEEDGGYRLNLTPKKRNLRRIIERMTLYLDASLAPVRTLVDLPKGDQLATEYRNIERRSFPDSQFEFTPPTGTNVTKPMSR